MLVSVLCLGTKDSTCTLTITKENVMGKLYMGTQEEQMQVLQDKLKELQNSYPSCLDKKYQVLPEDLKFNTLKLDTDKHISDIKSMNGAIQYLQLSMDYQRAIELIGD